MCVYTCVYIYMHVCNQSMLSSTPKKSNTTFSDFSLSQALIVQQVAEFGGWLVEHKCFGGRVPAQQAT